MEKRHSQEDEAAAKEDEKRVTDAKANFEKEKK
jgi:hypothetical protein